MAEPPGYKSGSSGQVWGWIVAVVVGILILSKCTEKSSTTPPSQFAALPDSASTGSGTPPPPPPIGELASADLRLGRSAFTKVAGLVDAASAVIYSKNCYAALADTFSWSKLDRCGAFDAMAAQQVLADAYGGSTEEAAYFESESAAQRYLSVGTAHGAVASVLDDRWASVSGFAQQAAAVASAKAAEEAAAREAETAAAAAEANAETSGAEEREVIYD